ncbi:MAG: PqqD family peptide modification chaperone [Lachnospiraceae bacterium]|nr:PqqD family peptide modification chaperone [Lachnospiraceae bacterium]
MRQNKSFILREIANIPYLLPYGQMMADRKHGVQVNATGAYLWKLLEQECTMEELFRCSAEYYEIPSEDLTEFQNDIRQFVKQLISYGIVIDEPYVNTNLHSVTLSIAGLGVKLLGPAQAFPQEFCPFEAAGCEAIHQEVLFQPGFPPARQNGSLLIRNDELMVLENSEGYILLFPQAKHIVEIHLSFDGSKVLCYCLPPYDEDFHYDIFHALRLTYLYLSQKKGMVALHSASLLYKEKAWLFSGHSGMGKSTHTNLWKKLYKITLLNGDLNLLAFENGQPVVHGIPWCGTSEICTTVTVALGGIILLNQASSDRIEKLPEDKKQLLVSQRLISPAWTTDLFDRNMKIVKDIVSKIMVCKLHCTKEPTASEVMKKYIDCYLDKLKKSGD